MNFEFDAAKSVANLEKHGIDFEDAQALWDDDDLYETLAAASSEPRLLAVGIIEEKHWTAIYTLRNDAIHLISVRRSRKEEIKLYESYSGRI